MRKPRDYDSELKALADKAKAIKERRVRQLGDGIVLGQVERRDGGGAASLMDRFLDRFQFAGGAGGEGIGQPRAGAASVRGPALRAPDVPCRLCHRGSEGGDAGFPGETPCRFPGLLTFPG